jgi:murein DD-endopeptidase MepM/ murein hydrolase activator NlpD
MPKIKSSKSLKNFILSIIFITAFLFSSATAQPVFASRIDDLQKKISDNNTQIAEIQKEIDELQKQLDKTGQDTKTLKNQIKQLETTIKNLKSNISLTERKITAANLNIEELNLGIKSKEEEIAASKKVLTETIKSMNEAESNSLIEVLLANASLSDFYGDIERIKDYQETVSVNLGQLKELKNDLQNQEATKEAEKNNLENLRLKLADQKKITETQNSQKSSLLKETQSRESEYKKLLADRLARQQALENEISAFEEQIRIEIDPNSLPKTGSGVLSCPVDNPNNPSWCTKSTDASGGITQFFGNTPFATRNPQVYGWKGHDGLDFRATIGTSIKSSGAGVITAIGNTVSFCRGSEIGYGKWVLIKHDNNLSTFYAHLSLIKVSVGDSVEMGQIIGYSGNTGYTTGPHLHFGVFATQAISGLEYTSTSKTCGGTIMHQPIVPPNGKLNPLSYL